VRGFPHENLSIDVAGGILNLASPLFTPLKCTGVAQGELSSDITGGVAPYQDFWSPGWAAHGQRAAG